MSRTTKDVPFHAIVKSSGIVKHDHRSGECRVGTYEDAQRIRKYHYKNCYVLKSVVECRHDHVRDALETAVKNRKRQNFETRTSNSMDYLLGEMYDSMFKQGYYPGCQEVETHSSTPDRVLEVMATIHVTLRQVESYSHFMGVADEYIMRRAFGIELLPTCECKMITCHQWFSRPYRRRYGRQEAVVATAPTTGDLKVLVQQANAGDIS